MKYIIYSLFLFLASNVIALAQNTDRETYILEHKDIAIRQMRAFGIPASITLAQGCLESGNGKSTLAVKANNHFGIKCHDWKGPSIRIDDDAPNECFRKYRDKEDSYEDHSNFLRYRDRYAFLFDYEITDYKAWAYGLKKAGYATDPKYANKLIKIIEEHRLDRYDKEGLSSRIINRSKVPSPAELEKLEIYIPKKSSRLYKYSSIRTLYTRNKVTYIIAGPNDSYESIAREYNLFTNELLRFNDLDKNREIAPGTIVYIEKKRNKAAKRLDIHIAEDGDSYYEIAQRYAIRLSSIYKFNELNSDYTEPFKDESIHLRKYKYKRF